MSKVTVHVLIPTHDNDKVEFTPDHHDAFQEKVAKWFEGFSWKPGLVQGGWYDDKGKFHDDTTMVLEIDVAGLVESSEEIWKLVKLAKKHYRQLKIRISYLGVSEIL